MLSSWGPPCFMIGSSVLKTTKPLPLALGRTPFRYASYRSRSLHGWPTGNAIWP
jgi:hypothetical protein